MKIGLTVEAGTDIRTIQVLLGNRDLSTTVRYTVAATTIGNTASPFDRLKLEKAARLEHGGHARTGGGGHLRRHGEAYRQMHAGLSAAPSAAWAPSRPAARRRSAVMSSAA